MEIDLIPLGMGDAGLRDTAVGVTTTYGVFFNEFSPWAVSQVAVGAVAVVRLRPRTYLAEEAVLSCRVVGVGLIDAVPVVVSVPGSYS